MAQVAQPIWLEVQAVDVLRSRERDAFRAIGDLPLTSIELSKVLKVLNVVEQRGAIETAHRLRQHISGIYIYAIDAGLGARAAVAHPGRAHEGGWDRRRS